MIGDLFTLLWILVTLKKCYAYLVCIADIELNLSVNGVSVVGVSDG